MTTANPNGRVFWAGLLLILAAFTATAQEFRGSLAGKITDPNGAVVPGSKVEIKNIETGVVASATTGDDGAYSFPLLPPGKYALTVTKENFNTAVREGIQVRVADRLTLDVQLEIGVTAMVTTVASGLRLDTGTVNTGTVVTGKQISELPLTEGTAYQLATLAPGIAYTGNPLFTGPTSNGNLSAFRSNGATGANQITLDGSPNYAFDGGVGFSPPSDAVQEFKVQTNTFDAQQGYSAGATVNVAVKSGSNDVHGSAWYFNRDRSRTANNFFGNASNQSRPIRTYHRFGGVFSGPVALPKIYNGTDRTFFLVSYERLKDNIAEPQIFTVPTEAMRRGDFSAECQNQRKDRSGARLMSILRIATVPSAVAPGRLPSGRRRWRIYPALPRSVLFLFTIVCSAQAQSLSQQAAATAMTALWRDSGGYPAKWTYDHGLVLKGIERVYLATNDKQYLEFIQRSMDHFVNDDGSIRTYRIDEYNIDHVLPGRNLLYLYKTTGNEKYRKAAALLREQLKTHPRTSEGGFWHKKIYPSQMWLDGLYMGQPFYAEYAITFKEDAAFDDIAKQFILMERHARDDKTGLLYHGWDESKQQRWANPATGRSPNFWGRAMGWYAMALVDTLDYFPAKHPQRAALIAILNRLARAVAKYQEPRSGLWYQVLDKAGANGNYLESSAACMFVYALAKGVRHGYLPANYLKTANDGYRGIQREFVKYNAGGHFNLAGTVSVAGLGGNPYRDGSYEYYLSEKVVTNDPKGIGAFLMAATELESAAKANRVRGTRSQALQ